MHLYNSTESTYYNLLLQHYRKLIAKSWFNKCLHVQKHTQEIATKFKRQRLTGVSEEKKQKIT